MIKLSPHFLGCLFRFSPIQPGLCPGGACPLQSVRRSVCPASVSGWRLSALSACDLVFSDPHDQLLFVHLHSSFQIFMLSSFSLFIFMGLFRY